MKNSVFIDNQDLSRDHAKHKPKSKRELERGSISRKNKSTSTIKKPAQRFDYSSLIVVIDTREQIPWGFPSLKTQSTAVSEGDYSILGYEKWIAVERKSFEDYLGSITHGRERFFQEIERLRDRVEHAAIVVEADWRDVLEGRFPGERDINPDSVVGTTVAIEFDYRVPVQFLSSREGAQVWAESFFKKFWRNVRASLRNGFKKEV